MPKTYCIGPCQGAGRTRTDARADAERQAALVAEHMVEGALLMAGPPRGCKAILISAVFHGGWSYSFLSHSEVRGRRWLASGYRTKAEAIWSAVHHAAQNVIDDGDDFATEADLDAIALWARAALDDEGRATVLRAELRDRVAWQKRHAAWKRAGATDAEAHRAACEGRLPAVAVG